MKYFEDLVKNICSQSQLLSFPDLLYLVREAIGIRQFKVAEHLGISLHKYRILEEGDFRKQPDEQILIRLSDIYGIPLKLLCKKLEEHISEKAKPKKAKL